MGHVKISLRMRIGNFVYYSDDLAVVTGRGGGGKAKLPIINKIR